MMKVAIVGAGAAGLACALELKRNNITPVIFESKGSIGSTGCSACINVRNLSRTITDPLSHIKNRYKLDLKPLNKLRHLVVHSPQNRLTANGNLGYILCRGPYADSIESQIYKKLDLPIIYNTKIELEDIIEDFDHIVIATGNNIIPRKLNLWTQSLKAVSRLAIIKGKFDPKTALIWFNTEFAKNTFAYLTPISDKSANLGLNVNDITLNELDYYWKKFLQSQRFKFEITETIDVESNCGFVNHVNSSNIYFIGNSGGFMDSFLGQGTLNAVESGILAGRCIAAGEDFNKSVEPIVNHLRKLNEFRKMFDTFKNSNYDAFVSILKTPLFHQIVYNNPFFSYSMGSPLAKLYNKFYKKLY